MVGYAQATRGYEGWGLEVVTDPAVDADGSLRRTLVETMLIELRKDGGRVHYWVNRPDTGSDAQLEPLGLEPDRELLEMRVPLPLAVGASELVVRPFRPGADDVAWLRINNRAFVDHPEQGGWDLGTLRERQHEPWFDASGFLVHEIDGRLAGSCWTKVHAETNPPMGEIYVISVDPAFQGRGLGRGLTVAGLDWLARQGLTVGMLYTTASNLVAVGLYRSLGFTIHRTQRVYTTAWS
jgi:mycothiol synthase